MAAPKPMMFRADSAPPPTGPPTAGMERHQLVEREGTWIGWVRTDPGFAGGWHHHADRESWIYQIAGEMTVEFGAGGAESFTARPGDVIVVPPRAIHREITPGESAEALVIRIGTGPQNVNVDGPGG